MSEQMKTVDLVPRLSAYSLCHMTLFMLRLCVQGKQSRVWLNNIRVASTFGQSKAVSNVVLVNVRLNLGQLSSFWEFSVSIAHFHIWDIPASCTWSQNQWAITPKPNSVWFWVFFNTFSSKKVIYLKYIYFIYSSNQIYRLKLADIKMIIKLYLEYYLCTMHIS